MISIGNLQINKLCLGNLDVAKAYLGDVQVYGSTPQPVGKYMTITALDGDTGTTISPKITGTLSPNLQYRINNGYWTDFVFGTTADIKVVAGDFVQWKGNNPEGISTELNNYLNFSISGNPVHLSGNVMSLIDGVGDSTVIPNDYCFSNLFLKSSVKTVSQDFLPATELTNYCYRSMFEGCTELENAPELPATTLAGWCYNYMFNGCTALVTAPDLPSTNLYSYCYYYMFKGCTSLTTAPALPATNLYDRCYSDMFKGCTSLTTAPELPATTLAVWCYDSMFRGCTSLVTAPDLPATKLTTSCYSNMFNGCTSLTTAPELPATTLVYACYDSMFYGCSSLTTAPALPATTLAGACYRQMFEGCTSLVKAPELPATTLDSNCYNSMFSGCTSLVKAPELPARTLASYCYSSMFQICKSLNYIKSLATDITATNALKDWLSGVAATGTFVKPEGVTYPTGASGIPENWSIVEEKPKPEGKYMTMTVLDGAEGTTIAPTVKGSIPNLNLQYRINSNGDWTNFIVGTTADIQVVSGDWVQFKGNNPNGFSIDDGNYLNFAVSGNLVALSGNVMSLIDGIGETLVVPGDFCFCKLFSTSNVKTVSSDFLPATTLTSSCYSNMFNGCTSLTTAPELPATTLADSCYEMMFWECSSLETTPSLPATTLANNCYGRMFFKCTSLVNIPEILPATTLADSCYIFMFYKCTSLTTAPELPATTLKSLCYQSMFSGCTSLNYVKCLATSGTINNGGVPMSLYDWLYNVSSTGTFVKPAGVEYVLNSDGGIPSGWTIQNI